MATRTATKATKPAEPAPQTGLNLVVRRSEGIERAKRAKDPNPTEEAVKATLTEGALAYDVPSEEDAKKVQALLRRAAQDNSLGLSMQSRRNSDGTWTVDFQAVAAKRARKYTAQDIRNWADGYGDPALRTKWGKITGPIPKECREAFKVAKGFAKSTVEEQNNQ